MESTNNKRSFAQFLVDDSLEAISKYEQKLAEINKAERRSTRRRLIIGAIAVIIAAIALMLISI